MVENLTGAKPTTKNEITKQINALSSSSIQDQFYLEKVNYNQVLHEIKYFHGDCSTGANNIPINLIKIVAKEGRSHQTAKICPIPKTDTPLTCKDFRPISLFTVLSKVFERIIMKQLCSFIEDRVIYSKIQSGFRKYHSTNTLFIKIRDYILNVISYMIIYKCDKF